MSRRSVLSKEKNRHTCGLCGQEITHDVVRIDEGQVYHMSCFSLHFSGGSRGLTECQSCRTLGALWNRHAAAWSECTACSGTGYLAAARLSPRLSPQ